MQRHDQNLSKARQQQEVCYIAGADKLIYLKILELVIDDHTRIPFFFGIKDVY